MIYHSTLSDYYLWYLILRGNEKSTIKSKKHEYKVPPLCPLQINNVVWFFSCSAGGAAGVASLGGSAGGEQDSLVCGHSQQLPSPRNVPQPSRPNGHGKTNRQ